MSRRSLWMGLCAAAVLLPTTARADGTMCDKRSELVTRLGAEFQEATIAAGVDNGGRLVEVLASDDGATWTILVSVPQGPSCVVAAGESWQAKRAVIEGPRT